MTTAKTYAGCQCALTPEILSARHARSRKVLHHNTTGGVVILIDSKVPRKWRAAVARADGSPWKGDANFNSASMGSYHAAQMGRGVNRSLSEPLESAFAGLPTILERAKYQYELSLTKPEGATDGEFLTPFTTPKKEFEGYTPRAKAVSVSTDEFHAPTPNPESHWYEAERDARLLKDFVALRLAGHTTNLMIVGPSGFGKTQGIIRFGKAIGVPVHVVNCQAITTPEKWIGQMQVSADKGTYFDVANHIKWVERTHEDCSEAPYCVILYDEITRLRPELANMQFSLLDDQQGLEVPQMGRRVNMNPKNVVIATANIGAPYAGTFTMDWALRGRFDMNLERNFPPADEEIKILTSAFDKLSDEDAASLVRVADHTRTLWQNGELESPISTRSLVSWARLIAGGYSIKDAAEYTIIPLYNEDGGEQSDRAKVKLAVDGKVAR